MNARAHQRSTQIVQKAIIETRGLVMRFGGVEVLRGIDFGIVPGTALPGRTQWRRQEHVLQMPHRAVQAEQRRDSIQDQQIGGLPSVDIARRGIGIKTQVPSLYDGLTAREHIWLAVRRSVATAGGFSREVPPPWTKS